MELPLFCRETKIKKELEEEKALKEEEEGEEEKEGKRRRLRKKKGRCIGGKGRQESQAVLSNRKIMRG